MSTGLTSLCMPQIHDRPVQFLGVCAVWLIFLRPIRIPFFPQLDLGSIKSTSNFTRPLKIAEITKRSFHAESNIIDGRPTDDLAYVYLIEISLSRSILSFLSPVEAPKMSITVRPQMEKRSRVLQRERVSITSFSMPNRKYASKGK